MAMLISEVARKYNEWWAGHTYQGVTTGYDIIDGDYQGWSPGELCVIGGRPGMGKTAFILSIIHHLVTQRIPIALFTHEDLGNPVFFKRVLRAITDKKPLKEMTVQELINQEDLADIQLHITTDDGLYQDRGKAAGDGRRREVHLHRGPADALYI